MFSGVHPLTGIPRDTRSYCPNYVKFNINLFDPKNGSILVRAESARLVADEQGLGWQHNGYSDTEGNPTIVDIGVLVLDKCISDFEAIKDKIISIPAHVLVNVDMNKEDMTIAYGYPRVAADVLY